MKNLLPFPLLLVVLCLTSPALAQSVRTVYVAPEALGSGNGASERTAAALTDEAFWKRVQSALQRGPVEVRLAAGAYEISSFVLRDIGHPEHRLVIRGAGEQTIVREDPTDTADRNNLWNFRNARNLTVSDLAFTGDAESGYALHFADSRDVLVEKVVWRDMTGIYYGAFGVSGAKAADVTVRDCTFTRIGSGGHAHMIYTAYGSQRINVLDSVFEDCAGDFVRFRDEVDYGVIYGCTFKSTGTYRNANPPMISMPLFNDDNPDDPPAKPNYEFFGTHFLIANNSFEYARTGPQDTRIAVLFHHSGFNPPGRQHLLSPADAEQLAEGEAPARKQMLMKRMGIDLDQVHLAENTFEHVAMKVGYRSYATYGATSLGFSGIVDLSDLPTAQAQVADAEAAAGFWERTAGAAPAE